MTKLKLFPVIASLAEPQALLQLIGKVYNLKHLTDCWLIRSYVNDVYKITTNYPAQNYILKIYRANLRSEQEIAYEQELLAHLAQKRVRVAQPIAQVDGRLMGKLLLPEGIRFYVLYESAPGAKPVPPFSTELYHHYGQVSAQLHQALDTFIPSYSRPPLDFEYLLDRLLQKADGVN